MARPPRTLMAEIRLPFLLGLTAVLVFCGGFGAWAALAPFARGIVASGQLVPSGHRRVIQHLEGGIIAEINVRDGMRVAQGDLLVRLQTTRQEADRRALIEANVRLSAEALSLRAERAGAEELLFPPALVEQAAGGLARILADEHVRFAQRGISRGHERAALGERLRFGENTAEVYQRQINARENERKIVQDRHGLIAQLVKSGSRPAFALLESEEQLARVHADLAEAMAYLERERQTTAETRAALAGFDDGRLVEIAERLSAVEAKLAENQEQVGKLDDMLARADIRAPINGIVLSSVATTIGGVIPPGATVMELVPDNEALVAELKVAPTDVDRVSPGAPCHVRLLAFPQRHMPQISGTVGTVSADVLQMPDLSSHYLVRVELDRASLADAAKRTGQELILTPGMPLQGVIEAGDDTFLGYLLEPLRRSFERAFKDS